MVGGFTSLIGQRQLDHEQTEDIDSEISPHQRCTILLSKELASAMIQKSFCMSEDIQEGLRTYLLPVGAHKAAAR